MTDSELVDRTLLNLNCHDQLPLDVWHENHSSVGTTYLIPESVSHIQVSPSNDIRARN